MSLPIIVPPLAVLELSESIPVGDRLIDQAAQFHREHRETGEGIDELALALGRHGAALLAIGADLLRTVEQLRASVEHSRTGTVEVDHDRCALR